MRVGVIGAGAAGLTSAWLLEEHHEVTLFEKDERLGGHAHTIKFEAHGQGFAVDAGFQFFGPGKAYGTFNRLLDALQVSRRSYAATMTLFHTGEQRPVVLPPMRTGVPVWTSLTPTAVGHMLRFRSFLSGIPSFLAQHDTTITIEDHIERLRLPASFTDGFLYPLLLALWCVELPDLRRFAAYNTLYYLGETLPEGFRPPQQTEIVGGMAVYVDALARSLSRTDIRRGVAADHITRDGSGYLLEDSTGRRHAFDHIVVATNARQALQLTESVPGIEPTRDQLGRFEYFDTTIAIHGDRRLMPRSEKAWSVVNTRWDGTHSQLSTWNPEAGLPVFRSWVTYEERMPEPLYSVATYQHGMITPDYFDAQARLKTMNGRDGLWLAGLYMDDADSHESAVRSAVTIARRLAPDSPRLSTLLG